MRSQTTQGFRELLSRLPTSVQESAKQAYALFGQNPNHPSLHFKKVCTEQEIYSVRITKGYRALGAREGDTIVWFWIGSHADYERILKGL
jgi:hypothetical protein